MSSRHPTTPCTTPTRGTSTGSADGQRLPDATAFLAGLASDLVGAGLQGGAEAGRRARPDVLLLDHHLVAGGVDVDLGHLGTFVGEREPLLAGGELVLGELAGRLRGRDRGGGAGGAGRRAGGGGEGGRGDQQRPGRGAG